MGTLNDQVELVSDAAIMVTMCGGAAVTSMFLPRGASIFVYYNNQYRKLGAPPRLDWDLLNNLSYLRVHWLPRPEERKRMMHEGPREADFQAFVSLIDYELDLIS